MARCIAGSRFPHDKFFHLLSSKAVAKLVSSFTAFMVDLSLMMAVNRERNTNSGEIGLAPRNMYHSPKLWYMLAMQELAISKFKVKCLAVVEEVRRSGKAIRITRFGKAVADLVPVKLERTESWLGSMAGQMEITGDIVGPVGAFEEWENHSK